MSFKSKAALVAIVCSVLFSVGCGDTFRPIAIPIVQNGGQPQTSRQVIALSTVNLPCPAAPAVCEGNTVHINVSGDTNVGQVSVGRDPVHVALVGSGTTVVVTNRAEESLTTYAAFSPQTAQPANFVSLPVGSKPVFSYSNVGGIVYVAESGANKVGVVSVSSGLTTEIQVGATPVGLIGTPDSTKLYVANQAGGTVSVVDTGSNVVLATITVGGGVGSAPSYLAINSAGTKVLSVNTGNNSVSVIDVATNTEVDVPVGTAPNFAYFDATNNRFWVTNGGSNSVSVINSDVNNPATYLQVTPVSLASSCGSAVPVSITVLADGSRAYVADSGCAAVSVINALSNAVTKTIAVGTTPLSIVSSPDSTKVYSANNGAGNVSIIQTSTDSVVTNLNVPAGSSPIYLAISPF